MAETSRGKLKDEDENAILKNFVWLKEQIEAKNIVDYLLQHGVLTLNDRERILHGATQNERMDCLLMVVLHAGPNNAFEVFLKSLEKNYRHVVEVLRQSSRDNGAYDLKNSELMEDMKKLNKAHKEEKQRMLAEKESLKLKHEREIKQLKEKFADLEKTNHKEKEMLVETIETLKKENEDIKNKSKNTPKTKDYKSTKNLDSDSDTENCDIYLEEDFESVKKEIQKFKLDLNKL